MVDSVCYLEILNKLKFGIRCLETEMRGETITAKANRAGVSNYCYACTSRRHFLRVIL